MRKAGKEVCVCYACRSRSARARSVGGTRYFLCDECYELHKSANRQVVEYLRNRRAFFRRNNVIKVGGTQKSRPPVSSV